MEDMGQQPVALNKDLIKKTSWRFMSHGASLGFWIGIAEIPKNKSEGSMYNFDWHKSGKDQGYYLLGGGEAFSDQYIEDNKASNFQMENQEWITLTYDPNANILIFFNEETGDSYKLKIKPKQQNVSYYPAVVLYKATVYQYDEPDQFSVEYYDKMYEEHLKSLEEEQRLRQEEANSLQKNQNSDPN